MIERWIEEVKKSSNPEDIGMILVHNGIVRGTSKQGEPVKKMRLSYDEEKLASLLEAQRMNEGIVEIRVWINSGELEIGDDIMYLLVAGRFRTDILPVFQTVLSTIKNEIVKEQEIR